MKFNLEGRVALVTGGSGVLGSAICRGLAEAGAQVAILARTAEKVEGLAESIHKTGGQALGVAGDVLDKDSVQRATQEVLEKWGRIDILVNGAGGNQANATALLPDRPFFDLPSSALQQVFDLNMMGTMLPSQVVGRIMVTQEQGVILNVSSMAALRPLTRVVAYAAAKAALNNFTQWLAVHLAQEYSPHIRVNAIAPGFFLGEQNRFLLIDEKSGKLTPRGQQIIQHTPLGRFGDPEDLIGTVLWLVSDWARFVTGIVVPVDGGFSAYSGV